jgi:hypothetical protein
MYKPNQSGDQAEETGFTVCGTKVNIYRAKTN